jgi:hypothetical protein
LPDDGFQLVPKHVTSNTSGINLVVVDGWYFPFITPKSGWNVIDKELSNLVDEDTTLHRNVGIGLPSDTKLYPRRTESSATPLRKP